jgi:hypothetical protein
MRGNCGLQNGGEFSTRFKQSRNMTSLNKELEWLREVASTALQVSLGDLDTADPNGFCNQKNRLLNRSWFCREKGCGWG